MHMPPYCIVNNFHGKKLPGPDNFHWKVMKIIQSSVLNGPYYFRTVLYHFYEFSLYKAKEQGQRNLPPFVCSTYSVQQTHISRVLELAEERYSLIPVLQGLWATEQVSDSFLGRQFRNCYQV